MFFAYYHTLRQLAGKMTLLLLVAGGEHASSAVPRGANPFTTLLAKSGLAVADLHNHQRASITTILTVVDIAQIKASHLAAVSRLSHSVVLTHLHGKTFLSDTSVTKLQAGMHQMLAGVAMEDQDRQYYQSLIDNLPQAIKVERAVSKIHKNMTEEELHRAGYDKSYLNNLLTIRNEAIQQAKAHLNRQPQVTNEEDKQEKIAAVLQKYALTRNNFYQHKESSTVVLQKIISVARISYSSRILKQNNIRLRLHFLGKETITDNTVAKLRSFIEQKLSEGKFAQQYTHDEITGQINAVFQELDQALRVERAAQSLADNPQLLNEAWTKRINTVLIKRGHVAVAPTRHKTSWQQLDAYKRSSQVVFIEIIDTLVAGGWLLPLREGVNRNMISPFLQGEVILADHSLHKIRNAINITLQQEPAITDTTKKETAEKLNALLSELSKALKTERLLQEIQHNINQFNDTIRQHAERAVAINNEHLLVTRFRVTWDDISAYDISFATTIKELLTTLNLSLREVARQTSLARNTISAPLKQNVSMNPVSLATLIHFLCATIATTDLPAIKTASLRHKALHLSKLNHIEKAAREILKDPALTSQLSREQQEMLHNVMTIKQESLTKF